MSVSAVLVSLTLIGSVVATNLVLQQQASAFVVIGGKQIGEFQLRTAQLKKDVISAGPAPHLIPEFLVLTEQFERAVISAAKDDPSTIPVIIVNYNREALGIFPDNAEIRTLLNDYSADVASILSSR